jgi:hypothetical protein
MTSQDTTLAPNDEQKYGNPPTNSSSPHNDTLDDNIQDLTHAKQHLIALSHTQERKNKGVLATIKHLWNSWLRHIDALLFTDDICAKVQARLTKNGKSDKERTTSKLPTVTLPAFDGSPRTWTAEKHTFLAYLGQQKVNRNKLPLLYVVRNELKRADTIDNPIADTVWKTPLQGPSFLNDNFMVYQILLQWTSGGNAEIHVDKFKDTNDGWGGEHSI